MEPPSATSSCTGEENYLPPVCVCRYTIFENGTLKVTNIQSDNTALYTCEIITDLDNVKASGSITVVGMCVSTCVYVWYISVLNTNGCPMDPQHNQTRLRTCLCLMWPTTVSPSAGSQDSLTTAPSQVLNIHIHNFKRSSCYIGNSAVSVMICQNPELICQMLTAEKLSFRCRTFSTY